MHNVSFTAVLCMPIQICTTAQGIVLPQDVFQWCLSRCGVRWHALPIFLDAIVIVHCATLQT